MTNELHLADAVREALALLRSGRTGDARARLERVEPMANVVVRHAGGDSLTYAHHEPERDRQRPRRPNGRGPDGRDDSPDPPAAA